VQSLCAGCLEWTVYLPFPIATVLGIPDWLTTTKVHPDKSLPVGWRCQNVSPVQSASLLTMGCVCLALYCVSLVKALPMLGLAARRRLAISTIVFPFCFFITYMPMVLYSLNVPPFHSTWVVLWLISWNGFTFAMMYGAVAPYWSKASHRHAVAFRQEASISVVSYFNAPSEASTHVYGLEWSLNDSDADDSLLSESSSSIVSLTGMPRNSVPGVGRGLTGRISNTSSSSSSAPSVHRLRSVEETDDTVVVDDNSCNALA